MHWKSWFEEAEVQLLFKLHHGGLVAMLSNALGTSSSLEQLLFVCLFSTFSYSFLFSVFYFTFFSFYSFHFPAFFPPSPCHTVNKSVGMLGRK